MKYLTLCKYFIQTNKTKIKCQLPLSMLTKFLYRTQSIACLLATGKKQSFFSFQLLWEKKAVTDIQNCLPGWGFKEHSFWAALIFKSNAWHKQETREATARLGISEKPDVSQACSIQSKSISKRMMCEKDKQFCQPFFSFAFVCFF